MDQEFMDKLQRLRDELGFALRISSGYRCPNHPIEIKKSAPGPHTTGRAADIWVHGPDARLLVDFAVLEFQGIGVNQKGPHSQRFIHLDLCGYRLWSYS